jgi:cytochrome c553
MSTRIARSLWAVLVAAGGLALAGAASGQAVPVPKKTGSDYRWNAMNVEKIDALELAGDVENGKAAYEEECASCHLPSGAGQPDGKFPQLARQHDTVLIKQIADIRAERRENRVMHPYSMKLIDAQEIADVAAYLQTLPIPPGNGKGPGGDHLKLGDELYHRDCVKCHGLNGEGNAEKFFPVLAGQHYEYLLRQIRDIAGLRRRNANPDMVKIVKTYKDEELQAVVDYMSRLHWPERAAKSSGG